ncbi:MAG: ATP synthase F1 subunit epsilon [Paramuribaculum sp.]|nr:ATP synthase F1 subunit epsilon [Paramuribaculum sp.]
MTLKIISTEDILFQGEVTSVSLPGRMGEFTVLRNHASLISELVTGKIRFTDPNGNTEEIPVEGGLADVDRNVISVCIF